MAKKYCNTNKERLQAIKEFVQRSNQYEKFKIMYESPSGDVLYLKRYYSPEYERCTYISNIFDGNEIVIEIKL